MDALKHPNIAPFASRIQDAAADHELPAALVAAIVLQESAGNPWAWNPEPHYRYLVDVATGEPFRTLTPEERLSQVPPKDFPCLAGDRDAEWWGQQASWGLMQLMGAVARELGMNPRLHLPKLCDSELNLDLGCKHLANLRRRFQRPHGWRGVVAAYNAGSPRSDDGGVTFINQHYVDGIERFGGFLFAGFTA